MNQKIEAYIKSKGFGKSKNHDQFMDELIQVVNANLGDLHGNVHEETSIMNTGFSLESWTVASRNNILPSLMTRMATKIITDFAMKYDAKGHVARVSIQHDYKRPATPFIGVEYRYEKSLETFKESLTDAVNLKLSRLPKYAVMSGAKKKTFTYRSRIKVSEYTKHQTQEDLVRIFSSIVTEVFALLSDERYVNAYLELYLDEDNVTPKDPNFVFKVVHY